MFALNLNASLYPQRHDEFNPTWLNRRAERWRVRWGTRRQIGQRHLRQFLKQIEAAAQAWQLDLQTKPDPAQHQHETLVCLRRKLSVHGFADIASTAQLLAMASWQMAQTMGMRPHTTQLMGAYVMLRCKVIEMDTGEGKSLTAALAAASAALAGCKVHVITVNDYLAERDAIHFFPFFTALGLTVAAVTEAMDNTAKKPCYQADVVYCANKIIVFDYLRDRLALGQGLSPMGLAIDALQGRYQQSVLLPGLQFAIVDEADSVFIDEARTPLVIAVERDDPQLMAHYQQSVDLARQLEAGRDFVIPNGSRSPVLTEVGAARLNVLVSDADGVWQGRRLREDAVVQALVALHVYIRDIDYIVSEDKAMIVDENTGRVMPDRSWERGLQQLIEIKEGIPVTSPRDSIARLSYQLFFRRYLNLSGMTGTCREVAAELAEVYGLGVVRIEPFRPSRRQRLPSQIYATSAQRWQGVLASVLARQQRGQPVLVGTRSILASEELAALLDRTGVAYQMLNAKQNAEEAAVVAQAGLPGQVTIATNMAGRGTDIKLLDDVVKLGGLHVILTEGHDNFRVDRQLAGRCARQGDPGSWEAILSLDDQVLEVYPRQFRDGLRRVLGRENAAFYGLREQIALGFYHLAQRIVSFHQARMRLQLMQADQRSRQSLSFGGVAE